MWLRIIAVMFSASLDGAVYMMQVGATLRQLTWKKRGFYSLISMAAAFAAAALSYAVAWFFKDSLQLRLQMICACLIIMGLGVTFVARSIRLQPFEERLDRSFSTMRMVKIAAITNIDTFFIGASLSFLNIPLLYAAGMVVAFAFATTLTALSVGYTLGAGHQRTLSISGGILMIVLGAMLLAGYL